MRILGLTMLLAISLSACQQTDPEEIERIKERFERVQPTPSG
ncbi:MAG: hypothetical protein AAGE80_06610 [Pseudomonadota bacterium]